MFTDREVIDAIRRMRKVGSDTQAWEVKEAVLDLPKSLSETISAFANLHGGMIILGLSERNGFTPAEGFDAEATYSKMQIIGDELTPVVRMEIEKVAFENSFLVVARVPETPRHLKPCFITARDRYEGSFVRTGDGDRHLTPYEVDRLLEFGRQPRFDAQAVSTPRRCPNRRWRNSIPKSCRAFSRGSVGNPRAFSARFRTKPF